MICDRLQDALLFFAAGVAEPEERDRIGAHLRTGCPVCIGRLAEAEATLAPLPLALAAVAPAPEIRERLMEKVAADASHRQRTAARVADTVTPTPSAGSSSNLEGTRDGAPPRSAPGRRQASVDPGARTRAAAGRPGPRPYLAPLLAAGLAAVLAGVAVYVAVYVPMHRHEATLLAQLTRQDARLRSLEDEVRSATMTVRMLRSPAVQVVSLGGAGTPGASGRIFWDRRRGEWRFYAADLKPPAPGRTYELWFITDDQKKIPAGTFDVNAAGEGELVAHVPEGVRLAVAAVTDEPAGGVPQPTGQIHIAGPLPQDPSTSS